MEERLVDIDDLEVFFPLKHETVRAVDGVSWHVNKGETLAIVGESGSGKSVTAMSLMRLTDYSGGKINLTASTDVILPVNVGLVLDGSGDEKIESDGTDINIAVGAGGDINIPADIPIHPTPCHADETSESIADFFMELIGLFPDLLPIKISLNIIGSPIKTMHNKYIRTNAPPPSVPALYGNPHILPNPTADPVAARTNVHFPIQVP